MVNEEMCQYKASYLRVIFTLIISIYLSIRYFILNDILQHIYSKKDNDEYIIYIYNNKILELLQSKDGTFITTFV